MSASSTLKYTRIAIEGQMLAIWAPGEQKQLDRQAFLRLHRTERAAAYLAFAWPRPVRGTTLARICGFSLKNVTNVMAPLLEAGSVRQYHLPQTAPGERGRTAYRLIRPAEWSQPCSS